MEVEAITDIMAAAGTIRGAMQDITDHIGDGDVLIGDGVMDTAGDMEDTTTLGTAHIMEDTTEDITDLTTETHTHLIIIEAEEILVTQRDDLVTAEIDQVHPTEVDIQDPRLAVDQVELELLAEIAA